LDDFIGALSATEILIARAHALAAQWKEAQLVEALLSGAAAKNDTLGCPRLRKLLFGLFDKDFRHSHSQAAQSEAHRGNRRETGVSGGRDDDDDGDDGGDKEEMNEAAAEPHGPSVGVEAPPVEREYLLRTRAARLSCCVHDAASFQSSRPVRLAMSAESQAL